MGRYFLTLLLVGAGLTVGLVLADPPGDKEELPRLKRKKKEPAKEEKKEAKEEKEKEDKLKEPKKGEDEPEAKAEPQEDEKEVLARIQKNMRASEEKLSKKELGEPTLQTQRDALADLDKLINRIQNPPPPPPQPKENKGGGKKGGGASKGGKSGAGGGGGGKQAQTGREARRARRLAGRNRRGGSARQTGSGRGEKSGGGKNGKEGGGKGGKTPPRTSDPKIDGPDGAWGHLPESLRADMNAYANPQPFMPRYDELIRKYYRTIAEQGRRKGD